MKKKSFVSLLLALCMSVGAISGCTKKEGVLELTIWNVQGTEHIPQDTSDENIPKKWLEEQSKVKVSNIYGNDGGQWDTKLSRLIAGDNLPDIIYVAGGQGTSHFAKIKDAKKLYALTPELIQEYAPNVWNRVPKNCWDMMTAEDGTILGIPFGFSEGNLEVHPNASEEELAYIEDSYKSKVTNYLDLHIRDDIAKKLFPEIKDWNELYNTVLTEDRNVFNDNKFPITTTEEYIKMFRDINAMNLTEDGKKVYAFGYDGGDLWIPFYMLGASMYGYATNEYFSAWNNKTKEIDVMLLGDLVKQAAKTQNELIREGVFDPESLVHNSTAFKENVMNGLYAVTSMNYAGGLTTVNKNLEQLGKDFRYIPFNVQIPSVEEYPVGYYDAPWTAAICITTNMNDEEVKQILNWVNIQFSDEFEEILWWGTPEDGLYTEENGLRKYVDDRFNKRYIDGDTTALSVQDCKGIGSAIIVPEAEFYVLPTFKPNGHWNPQVQRQISTWSPDSASSYKPAASADDVILRPQSSLYAAPYAKIDECVELWAKREQWESPFKIALGSDSEESFEKLWQEAVENLKSITNIDAMCDKMTEMARQEADGMGLK